MTQREKRDYMKICLNLVGVNVNDKYAAIVVELYEHVLMYKGNVNLKQITSIEHNMEYQYDPKDKKD